MEEGFSRREDVYSHLLQLCHNQKLVNNNTISEGKKLELRLAPPGDEEDKWSHGNTKNKFQEKDDDPSLLSLGNSYSTITSQTTCSGSKRGLKNSWLNEYHQNQQKDLIPVMGKESSQRSCSKGMENTAGPNTSQKRSAPAPVVGWPPIRSFRKNIASSTSTKQQKVAPPQKNGNEKQVENRCKGLFVKINMDGVPIGRKVDLKAYDNYEKLSCSVDGLFRGLLAAQRDEKIQNSKEDDKLITGLLDGRGEYTLVYEDNEGDRMLVGDVPWHMFVSTVKRLRVLKSSELSSLFRKQEKNSVDGALKQ